MALSELRYYCASEAERRRAIASGNAAFEAVLGHVFPFATAPSVPGVPDTTPLFRFRRLEIAGSTHFHFAPGDRPLASFYGDERYGDPYRKDVKAPFAPVFEGVVGHLFTKPGAGRVPLRRMRRNQLGPRMELTTASEADILAIGLDSYHFVDVPGFVLSAGTKQTPQLLGAYLMADALYTTDPSEIAAAKGYTKFDGKELTAYLPVTDRLPIYRFLHPTTLDQALATGESGWIRLEAEGYRFDGAVGFVPPATEPSAGVLSLYGLFHPGRKEHLYTSSPVERRAAVEDFGYIDLGRICYIDASPAPGSVPLLRLRGVDPKRRTKALLPPLPRDEAGDWLLLGERSPRESASKRPEDVLASAAERAYSGVRVTAGAPLLDRDLNLLGDIATASIHEWIESWLGNAALVEESAPAGGFAIGALPGALGSPSFDGDFTIGAGAMLAGGVKVQNTDAALRYSAQSPPPAPLDHSTPPPGAGPFWADIVYLDVWLEEREGDPNKGDLAQPTTTLSVPRWRVEVARGAMPERRRGHRHVPLAALFRTRYTVRPGLVTADHLTDLRLVLDLRPGSEVDEISSESLATLSSSSNPFDTWGHFGGPAFMLVRLFKLLALLGLPELFASTKIRVTSPITRGQPIDVARTRLSVGKVRVLIGGREVPSYTLPADDSSYLTHAIASVDPATPLGPIDLTMADDLGSVSVKVNVVAPADKPTIVALSPQYAPHGRPFNLILEGTELEGATDVTFAPAATEKIEVEIKSPVQIIAKGCELEEAGIYKVTVTTAVGTSKPVDFLVE